MAQEEGSAVEFDMEGGLNEIEAGLGEDLPPVEGEGGEKLPAEGVAVEKPVAEAAPEKPAGEKEELVAAAKPEADPNDKAPDTWTPVGKEKWASLPPEVKEEIRKREGDVATFVQRTQAAANVGQFVQKELGKYTPLYTQRGIDPGQLLPTLLQSHAILVTGKPEDRVAVLQAIAQGAGLDIADLAQGGTGVNPVVEQMQARINALESQLTQVSSGVQSRQYAELEQQVNAFIDAKDDQGQPVHPYFDLVWQDMQQLLQANVARGLKDAYEQAVWRNPLTRSKETDRIAAAKAEKARREAEDKLEKARRARGANVRSSGQGGRGAPPVNWEEDLANIAQEIAARP